MSYTIQEFDNIKTKMLKYIMYKKRTEKEVRQKFSSSVDEILLDDVIENLKELGYINDLRYVERAVNEFVAINTLSIREIEYKLYQSIVFIYSILTMKKVIYWQRYMTFTF